MSLLGERGTGIFHASDQVSKIASVSNCVVDALVSQAPTQKELLDTQVPKQVIQVGAVEYT